MESSSSLISSLYVGDLHPSVGELELIECFSPFGYISSARVCRDRLKGASLRYAYVNFGSRPDALNALESLNHTMLKGKPMRIMWSQRDPHMREIGMANLFVKNLDLSVDSAMLHEAFAKFGSVLSCKVAEENGKRKGYGYVQFESEEAAQHAVESLHGSFIGDKKVYVTKFVKKSERQAAHEEPSFTNVYVNNLDYELTDDLLKEKFSTFGTVKNAAIMKDDHGQSRGFGFVCFESPEDAKKAVETMNGAQIGSKNIYAGRAQKKCERELTLRRQVEERRSQWMEKFQGSKVYVKNLDSFTDDHEVEKHFSTCGKVISVNVVRDNFTGLGKGYGFVCFSTPGDANKAVNDLNGSLFHGRQLCVTIAQRRENRRAKLKLQIAKDSVPFPTSTSSNVYSSYHIPHYYSPPTSAVSQIYQYQYEPFGESQMMILPPSHGQQGYETTLSQMVPSKQRQQTQMGDSVIGITSQYPQHVPLLPYVQPDLVYQLNTQAIVGQQVSSKQRHQRQMGNWTNGITSQYPQHAPLHPYMQHEPVPVNTHDIVGQQPVNYNVGCSHHSEMKWRESERRKPRLTNVNKKSSFSGPHQGFGVTSIKSK
ncbi:hypothetical protein AAC387_Pa02g2869 [Persea americana]